jgi:RNA polymerase sigma factor (sigma-70 family)
MRTQPSTSLSRHLHTLHDAGVVAGLTDKQLLERFNSRRAEASEVDASAEAAFTALVARHGPMVLGVCQRALSDRCDIEDAFQATFLILVRKAETIQVHDSLGRWLYGVARRVAARARKVDSRRKSRTTPLPDDLVSRSGDASDRIELAAVLDEELARLPARYRLPLTMCYLAGLSNEEAARRLGCPLGTVQSRLSRGRDRLRARLRRRGLAPIDSVSLTALASGGMRPAVPAALSNSAVRAAMRFAAGKACGNGAISGSIAALTEGVLKTMTLDRLRSAVVIVLFLVAASMTAAGVLDYGDGRSHAQERASVATVSLGGAPASRGAEEAPEDPSVHLKPLEPLLGDWDVGLPNQPVKPFRVVFQWKGNRSCMAYRSFEKQGEDWTVVGTGMIFWDPKTRAIRETTFEESTDLFQDGTWKPERDRLVGEFVDYLQGAMGRKSHCVIRFVDRDTLEMTGQPEFEFKRSRRGKVVPNGHAESGEPFSLRVYPVDAKP